MKTSIITIIYLWLLCINISCENEHCHKHIAFKNNADIDVYIKFTYDTLGFYILFSNPLGDEMCKVKPHTKNTSVLWQRSCYESYIKNYIRIYIFDANVLATVPWNIIGQYNMVLQCYDLTKEDLQRLNWEVTYPPTEAMKDVQMYPPYNPPY
jgi:hypothetical protein